MKTKWKIVAIDESQHWLKIDKSKTGRLFGLYLFDSQERVYACEITPSYEMNFLETVPEYVVKEGILEQIQEGDSGSEPVTYMHCSLIRNYSSNRLVDLDVHDETYLTEEEYDALRDEMLEYLKGNPKYPSCIRYYSVEDLK